MSEWISVKDNLPDENVAVLIHQKTYMGLWIFCIAVMNNGRWNTVDFWDDDVVHGLNPTHWQPLPEPPKGINHD